MHTINGHPYINLESFVDLAGLEAIKKDIIWGIVKSRRAFEDTSSSTQNLYNQNGDPSLLPVARPENLQDPNNPNYEYFKRLDFNRQGCLMFSRYAGKYQQMGQSLHLRSFMGAVNIKMKSSAKDCIDYPMYENFPSLRAWIEKQNIFSEIGRILFFLNSPHEPHAIHRDTFVGYPDNFIHINLDLDRKDTFILDDKGREQVIKSKVSVFDVRNWHGSRGKDYYGWTLRFDGKFSKEWAERAGIWEYFKPIE